MALDGGGGGGGLLGFSNSFTGSAQALEVIGDHAYAYSGQIQCANSAVTHLEFTTGNYYFVGTFNGFSPSQAGEYALTNEVIYEMSLNGSAQFSFLGPSQSNGNVPPVVHIVIPPYTEVKITGQCADNAAGNVTSCNLVGRIYR
tara:strand:+ start:70 stop:501 length:432 start_codon:yes stop_codon:yes gene_type:complete